MSIFSVGSPTLVQTSSMVVGEIVKMILLYLSLFSSCCQVGICSIMSFK